MGDARGIAPVFRPSQEHRRRGRHRTRVDVAARRARAVRGRRPGRRRLLRRQRMPRRLRQRRRTDRPHSGRRNRRRDGTHRLASADRDRPGAARFRACNTLLGHFRTRPARPSRSDPASRAADRHAPRGKGLGTRARNDAANDRHDSARRRHRSRLACGTPGQGPLALWPRGPRRSPARRQPQPAMVPRARVPQRFRRLCRRRRRHAVDTPLPASGRRRAACSARERRACSLDRTAVARRLDAPRGTPAAARGRFRERCGDALACGAARHAAPPHARAGGLRPARRGS